jgi:hypothetical protein
VSIDKTTLNRIRIAIQHALCSTIHDDVNYESMAKACVDLGIIEKAEDFDTETFDHAPILFEKLWEKIGDSHYKSPLELFEAWGKDEVAIYRLGDELEDFPESALAWEVIFNALSDDEPTSNFLFVGEDFAKLYIDRTVAELNDMQREAFELMQEYYEKKERHDKAMFIGAKIFGRQDGKTHKTKEGRKFIRMYDPETGEYLWPLIKSDNAKDNVRLVDPETNEVIGTVCVPMTHEEAHGKKEPVRDIKVNFNKEAWDKLKYEHDTDQSHFKLAGAALFNPDKGVLEVTLENDNDVEQLVDILNNLSELPKDIGEGTKNSAEIFCRVTGKGYMDFNRYGAILRAMSPKDTLNLPFVVDETVRKINLIAELADLDLNVLILVYAIYKAKYEPANYSYGSSDVIFDIVDSMLELKKEGMIQ